MKRINEYLTTKLSKSTIKATDDTIRQIVKEEMDKYGHDCDLNHVDVSEVTYMNSLFSCHEDDYLGESYSDLNPDISEWNVSNVTNMGYTFGYCKRFNCNISKWDVSNVRDMSEMFLGCTKFNQDLNEWNVSNIIYMQYMFYGCENFNQDLSEWNVMNVTNMTSMFEGCTNFNRNLSKWNVNKIKWRYSIFNDCPIQEKYKPHFEK